MADMNSKELDKYFAKVQQKRGHLEHIATYVKGHNDAILKQKDAPKPDNRIPVPLAKSAITDIVGYSARPGEIVTKYTKKDEDLNGESLKKEPDKVVELLNKFNEHNKEGLENSELLKTSLSYGISWELWWISDDLELKDGVMTPEFKILDNRECWPVYNDSLKPKMKYFIRYHKKEEGLIADIYYPLYSERWIKAEGEDLWMLQSDKLLDNEGNAAYDPQYTKYPFKNVPVIPSRTSMDNTPVFLSQKRIIDSFDSLVSKTQNEVDRYNALITLFPGQVTKKFIEDISEALKPYIDNLDDYEPEKWPKYLEKNLSGIAEFYDSQSDRLERLFHKTIKVPDMSDKEFAGDQSGVAIAYKLIGFEFLVSEIEIYFRQGLEARYDFYSDILESSTVEFKKEDYELDIVWNRNLPVDDEMKLRIAAMLKGLGFSMDIINKYLPNSIVDEKFKELQKLEDEENSDIVNTLAAGEGSPEEVKAQAVLAGVNVKNAREIAKDVASGLISRQTGIDQIVTFFGFTVAQAEKIVGKAGSTTATKNGKKVTIKAEK